MKLFWESSNNQKYRTNILNGNKELKGTRADRKNPDGVVEEVAGND